MGIRMKKLLPSHPWSNGRGSILLFLTLALAFLFVACGDDDSSSFVEPEKETSSSEVLSSSDGTSDGNGGKSSSSVSSSSTNSSSSAKSSSSERSGGDPSSSSVTSSSSGTSSESSLESCNQEGRESTSLDENNQPVDYICKGGFWVPLPKSSSSLKSSSSYFDMSKQYREGPKYGTFVDPRDNQEYRTITVEKQGHDRILVILASNLNYGKMVTAETATYSDGTVEKFCYNDDPWYCENGFGGMYTWSEAMGLPRACDTVAMGSTPECPEATGFGEDGRRQGICPEGWHVMNEFEWRMMPTNEGFRADPMLSKVFDGDDDIGLAVLLGGWIYYEEGNYTHTSLGEYAYFWVVEETSPTNGVATSFIGNKVNFSGERYKTSLISVRCVKDY